MGYTGVCWDDAMAESFFATLKAECYYRRVWPTKKGARLAEGQWIEDRGSLQPSSPARLTRTGLTGQL
ncbi:MAG: hypothetical protein HIU84_14790 [Acidobacteria bacterium]|nr:hypothetical protein [Acidobacteriota bacterium]